MRVSGPVVDPATAGMVVGIADDFHCHSVGTKTIGHVRARPTEELSAKFQKPQRRLAILTFGDENLQHLAFVIYGAPQVMGLAVDLDEGLVQVSAPSSSRFRSP